MYIVKDDCEYPIWNNHFEGISTETIAAQAPQHKGRANCPTPAEHSHAEHSVT
jgi:hypothetical protein